MIIRPITPPLTPPHVLNVSKFSVFTTNATPFVIGLSQDRATAYGAYGTILYQSVNDGTAWTSVHTFAENVIGMIETDDGEALCATQASGSTQGFIYKSSGWTASHTAATWTKVLSAQSAAYFRNMWGFGAHSFGADSLVAGTSKYGLVGEYGSQTPIAGAATAAYFTQDYGATWTKVYDITTLYPGLSPDHILCCAYDPWWDRLVVCHETIPAGGNQQLTYVDYSDDHGATWTTVPLPSWVVPGQYVAQNTTISILEDAYILGSDHAGPGIVRIPRIGYRKLGNPYDAATTVAHTGSQMISSGSYRHRGLVNAPILFSLQSQEARVAPVLIVSFDGRDFVEVWRDDLLKLSAAGEGGQTAANLNNMSTWFGPTQAGNYLGALGLNEAGFPGRGGLLVGELIAAQPGDYSKYLTVTGDGTTTVFTFAHGLGRAPIRYFVVPQTYTAVNTTAPTVTVDATNITLTFGAAPANAAVLGFATRYA